jgi:hypothetical protein
MDTSLNSLDPRFKPIAIELLARLTEARIAVLISNTRRTAAEQAVAVAAGNSWVQHSKHEDGLAIDVVPYSIYELHGDRKALWSTNDPVWLKIGAVGEALGLRWGGKFAPLNVLGVGKDPGHFELVVPPSTGVPV